MVLESLVNPFVLKKRPWEMLIAGYVYAFVAAILANMVFAEGAGLLMVFLIVLSALPTLYVTIKNEEELDMKYDREWFLLKEHTKVLIYLMFLFLGMTLAMVTVYVFFPETFVQTTFAIQEQAIVNVNKNVEAGLTGHVTKFGLFASIFFNNLKVLFFCLVFSLLYGTGALFILTWNASVVAAAMGSIIKSEVAQAASVAGFGGIAAYFGAASHSFLRYMVHGLTEMAAYFIAGLAGGIISIALIKHNLKEDRVLVDALDLILISIGVLFIAGLMEVYITPIIA